jgi:hypothetical protein
MFLTVGGEDESTVRFYSDDGSGRLLYERKFTFGVDPRLNFDHSKLFLATRGWYNRKVFVLDILSDEMTELSTGPQLLDVHSLYTCCTNKLVAATHENKFILWNIDVGTEPLCIIDSNIDIFHAALSPDGDTLMVYRNRLTAWTLDNQQFFQSYTDRADCDQDYEGMLLFGCYSNDGNYFAMGKYGKVTIHRSSDLVTLYQWEHGIDESFGAKYKFLSLEFSFDASQLLCCHLNGIHVWNAADGMILCCLDLQSMNRVQMQTAAFLAYRNDFVLGGACEGFVIATDSSLNQEIWRFKGDEVCCRVCKMPQAVNILL